MLSQGCYALGVLYRILKAEVVYSGLGTARADGAVVVQGEGEAAQIVSIEGAETAARNYFEAARDHLGFALSPAPVNAHTHFDLTRMAYTPGDYESFIREVVAHAPRRRDEGLAAAKEGVAELRRYGVETVGDIVTQESVMAWLLGESGLKGVAYWEVFGPDPADADRIFDETVERLKRFRAWERPGGVRLGLSPHTPHTVSAPLLQRLAGLARGSNLPLQIHVAESLSELELHRAGKGPLMELMERFLGAWQPSSLSPVGYLESLGVLEARPTLVHMVNVSEEDVRQVARAGCVVVHCPRSNLALGSGRFPWELYMKHGVEVAFGTDSRSSSPNLSIEAEVKAAGALHGERASPLALVRAAVKGGYRALDMKPPRLERGDSVAKLHVWSQTTR